MSWATVKLFLMALHNNSCRTRNCAGNGLKSDFKSSRANAKEQTMDFEYSAKTQEMQARVRDFMDRYVIPAQKRWREEVHGGQLSPPVLHELKELAKSEGLWNLFLPGLRDDEPGTRLTNLEYAPLAEI